MIKETTAKWKTHIADLTREKRAQNPVKQVLGAQRG
jgi:hypothetical protein